MTASLTLHQVTSVVAGPLYRVVNTVTAAENSSIAVFVFRTYTQVFSHYAMVGDMEVYPDTYAAALTAGLAFYRSATVTRNWETVTEMETDLQTTQDRLQLLATDLTALQTDLVLDRTVVLTGEE